MFLSNFMVLWLWKTSLQTLSLSRECENSLSQFSTDLEHSLQHSEKSTSDLSKYPAGQERGKSGKDGLKGNCPVKTQRALENAFKISARVSLSVSLKLPLVI